ncbi:unnamed protein product [Moneuplotes crassus]|uniref:Uncharacterized protein n=1 Tax=Euplotes crassus TaxID=5936 RepID=A0AAD1Y4N5_EUPCR|nr:unnamed protein product [Moneuplotes crassus]
MVTDFKCVNNCYDKFLWTMNYTYNSVKEDGLAVHSDFVRKGYHSQRDPMMDDLHPQGGTPFPVFPKINIFKEEYYRFNQNKSR